MGLGKTPDRPQIMHDLDDRICIGIEYMCLQSTIRGLVIEPISCEQIPYSVTFAAYSKSKSSTPNLEYSISTLRYITGTSSTTS
jgi:hypothetical protein